MTVDLCKAACGAFTQDHSHDGDDGLLWLMNRAHAWSLRGRFPADQDTIAVARAWLGNWRMMNTKATLMRWPASASRARLIVPVHPRKTRAALAGRFGGIDHFTAVGLPVCRRRTSVRAARARHHR